MIVQFEYLLRTGKKSGEKKRFHAHVVDKSLPSIQQTNQLTSHMIVEPEGSVPLIPKLTPSDLIPVSPSSGCHPHYP
jgi:hypothetical protein